MQWLAYKLACYIAPSFARCAGEKIVHSIYSKGVGYIRGTITLTVKKSRVYIIDRGTIIEIDPRKKYIIERGEIVDSECGEWRLI